MPRLIFVHAITLFTLLLPFHPVRANEIATDANIVTALDVSDSIMRHEEWLEFEGLAKAVTSAPFLDAIAGGAHGRVGFAVFTWSSGGWPAVLVPWTRIETIGDARKVAAALRRAPKIDRTDWRRGDSGSDVSTAHRTDISAAINAGLDLLLGAPFPSPRRVINICANGADNVAPGPRAARDRALAAGVVINALAIGPRKSVAAYLDQHVRGGPGSFAMEVLAPARLAEAMLEKLLRDLIAAPGQSLRTARST